MTMTACSDSVAAGMEALLRSRRSVRAFRPDPVTRSQVLDVLSLASTAPSNSNTQPWQVHVLAGPAKEALAKELLMAHEANALPPAAHFPDALPERFRARQEDFGKRYYATLGIDRADTAARARQTGRNFMFFDAPVGLIFTIDGRLKAHSWLDFGLFIQNVMLAARAHGLDTCPQVSFARFQPVIARYLGLGEFDVVACGMSMGYADEASSVNSLRTPRAPIEDFAKLIGFAD